MKYSSWSSLFNIATDGKEEQSTITFWNQQQGDTIDFSCYLGLVRKLGGSRKYPGAVRKSSKVIPERKIVRKPVSQFRSKEPAPHCVRNLPGAVQMSWIIREPADVNINSSPGDKTIGTLCQQGEHRCRTVMCSSFSNKMAFLQHSNFAITKDDSGIQSDEASPHYANELQTGPKSDDVIGGLRSAANLAKQDPANHPHYSC